MQAIPFGAATAYITPLFDLSQISSSDFNPLRDMAQRAMQQGAQQGAAQGGQQGAQQGTSQGAQQGTQQGMQAGAEDSADGIGKVIAGGIAAAFAAAGVADLIGNAMDRESANAVLSAGLGLSPEDSAKAGQIAGSVYANAYGESIEDANLALKGLLGNGQAIGLNVNTEGLQEAAQDALNLSSIMDETADRVTLAATQMVEAGLAPNIEEAMDLLTVGQQKGANGMLDMLDTFNEYSVYLKAAGLTGEQSVTALTQALNAGARNSDVVTDAFKELGLTVRDPGVRDSLKAIGLDFNSTMDTIARGGPEAGAAVQTLIDKVTGLQDPMLRGQATTLLFGGAGEDLSTALNAIDLNAVTTTLGDFSDASEKVDSTLSNTASSTLTSFKRSLENNVVSFIGGTVLPIATEFFNILYKGDYNGLSAFGIEEDSPIIDILFDMREGGIALGGVLKKDVLPVVTEVAHGTFALIGFMAEHQDLTKGLIITIGVLTVVTKAHAAAMAIQAAGGFISFAKGTALATSATRAYTAVQWLLNVALSANPIGIVVIALAALTAGFIYAYKHSETFRDIVMGAWEGIQEGAGIAVDFLVGTVFPVLVGFGQGFMDVFRNVGAFIRGVFEGLVNILLLPLRMATQGINFIIRGINNVDIDIPDWVPEVGGKSFGIDIPLVPSFATGGTVKATPGGRIIRVAEAGRDEVVADAGLINKQMRQQQQMIEYSFATAGPNKASTQIDIHINKDGVDEGRLARLTARDLQWALT